MGNLYPLQLSPEKGKHSFIFFVLFPPKLRTWSLLFLQLNKQESRKLYLNFSSLNVLKFLFIKYKCSQCAKMGLFTTEKYKEKAFRIITTEILVHFLFFFFMHC